MTKLEFSTSPTTASILAGSSCRLTTVSSKAVPTEREQPKDKFSRLPSLEKVSRDPVEYDCYGLPNSGKIGKEWPMYRLNVELVLSLPNKLSVCR
ncbi:MAG: hypothetical protein E5X37_32715 [Mesorhizobium sp.]|uniref:hypothetical protein n=1 Tax=Mesorhizobium sp. TaxID=1871066 RepID=UPI00120A3B04|nr:hypothetical protein [Mesorhizobium sp.]TIR03200.1 MAG: hypothetical protein E5X37_32715 [Mesorhizobium sp.]